ncbi:MAG TPA: PDZ domain-containing protein [Candidatus Binataceae bacterium]|nr:PDZ domain-containing protein [Candidatus Binataceae bacterium]
MRRIKENAAQLDVIGGCQGSVAGIEIPARTIVDYNVAPGKAMKGPKAIIYLRFILMIIAGLILQPSWCFAQNGVLRSGAVPPGTTNNEPLLPADSSVAPGVPANPTLVIAPRVIAPPSPAAAPSPSGNAATQEDIDDAVSDATGTADDALHMKALTQQQPAGGKTMSLPEDNRPYLGLSVQYIVSHDSPWKPVQGLEVVSVDKGSPAALAGLKGRGEMTSVGETGATASTMMAPLNLIVMPLLAKSGSLGKSGDLIVAIDDKRVDRADALREALDSDKPGDTIYLTIERGTGSKQETIKLPVKLAAAKPPVGGNATAEADRSDN